MHKIHQKKFLLRVHLTNVVGLGASYLVNSLLCSLEKNKSLTIENIYLPTKGLLSNFKPTNKKTLILFYHRFVPNSISRFFECTFFSYRFNGKTTLLVLGDLPLRCNAPQILFVQQSLIFSKVSILQIRRRLKNLVSRFIFIINQKRVSAFIVQTSLLKLAIENRYPETIGRVHVIPQPPPLFLINNNKKRTGRISICEKLNLFYPAAYYDHKNHKLLELINLNLNEWPIQSLKLTIENKYNPNPEVNWIYCSGKLSYSQVVQEYTNTDALLFLSKNESYGLPLIEAMYIGLPIVCPSLPYAQILCSNQAIYFNPDDINSLKKALDELQHRLKLGWWPDWTYQLSKIPLNWDITAEKFLKIAKKTTNEYINNNCYS